MAGPTALATPDHGLRSPRTARKGVGTPTDKLGGGRNLQLPADSAGYAHAWRKCVSVTQIQSAASAGYVAVREVAPAEAGLGCRGKVEVVLGPGRGLAGLQVRPALCTQGSVRADGRFHCQLATWRLSGRVKD